MSYEHKSVLLQKVIEFLSPKESGIYFDGTLGGGGYSEAILEASKPCGRVIGVDFDEDAIEAARVRLEKFGDRFQAVRGNFADVVKSEIKFDGMVLDLGVSSFQLDEGKRGFSFSKPALLDMRMDKRESLTAEIVINGYAEKELESIFKNFGEEKFCRRIAAKIVEERRKSKIDSTLKLAEICSNCYPPALRHGRINPATKVFQALRIEVNGELKNLEHFLNNAPNVLKKDGRLVIVSYHSLEDRIVKMKFKELSKLEAFLLLTKKPIYPDLMEINKNKRARSAKLRGIVKVK